MSNTRRALLAGIALGAVLAATAQGEGYLAWSADSRRHAR